MRRLQACSLALCGGLSLLADLGCGPLSPQNTVQAAEATSEDAAVLAVSVRGTPQAYTFGVQVRSPDAGCTRYANWWEVVTPDGKLVYRRILQHSHKDEQPFTRTGGPIPIAGDNEVIVRVHVHPDGYARTAMRGSPLGGFSAVTLAPGWAQDLEKQAPLPESCAF